jgi:hypothetical protein
LQLKWVLVIINMFVYIINGSINNKNSIFKVWL